MSPLEYFRPKTIAEALALLDRGLPLAGGTFITPRRRELNGVIDLRDLGLDQLAIEEDLVVAGASLTLQALLEARDGIPVALINACRLEAAWNIRNIATLGGTILSADGRSPLLTVLLALGTEVILEPGSERVPLTELLDRKPERSFQYLLTTILFPIPAALVYEQVARTPFDRPVVCAAIGHMKDKETEPWTFIALGGFGARPIRVPEAEASYSKNNNIEAASQAANRAFAQAGDVWASARYRSHVAGVLVGRLLREVAN